CATFPTPIGKYTPSLKAVLATSGPQFFYFLLEILTYQKPDSRSVVLLFGPGSTSTDDLVYLFPSVVARSILREHPHFTIVSCWR
ncbi:hypothetical protein Moror_2651, partial [Moniliophthora roreri MCA 2997]